jgi:RND family efflux transporter MFP subunit
MKLAIAIAAVLGAAALAGCERPAPPPEPVRPVQLAQVNLGTTAATAVLAGEIKPRFETDLGFRIAGKLIERKVDVGARVRRGQTLARLDPADVSLQMEAAKAGLNVTETDFAFTKAEVERYQNLFAQKFISASALDAKRSAYESARAKVEQARAQFAVNQNQAGYATLTAPEDGVITAVNVEAGQVVGIGQAVMKLARESEREVAISVPENRLGELRSARALLVSLWANPGKLYPARVREVAPAVDPVTRTFAVRVSILEPDPALQWGMTANVGVMADTAGMAALLPLSSVYHATDGAPAVWIYDPQTHQVALRKVKLGAYRQDGVLIEAGVNQGEWVVAAGVNKLQPGQVVRPYETTGPTAPAQSLPAPAQSLPAPAQSTPAPALPAPAPANSVPAAQPRS